MRAARRILIQALAAVVFASASHAAGGAKKEGPAGAPTLDLTSFMAPVRMVDNTLAAKPFTVVLEIADSAVVTDVCRMMPRIMDAVLQDLYRMPIPMADEARMELKGLDERLRDVVNQALGRELINATHVFQGMRSGGGGGGSKFANSRKCR
jgi:hypothetical protein